MKKIIAGIVLACIGVWAAPTEDGMYATLQTTMGDICFELYYTDAPKTVANFVSLAEGTRPWIDPRTSFVTETPYYNGITFHRVINNFMIQCGSPQGDGTDGPGYQVEDEFDPSLRHDTYGVVSMANSGFDSNGGQFFITLTNTPYLDDVHSVFGEVVEGMNIVSNIGAVAVNGNARPLVDVVITNTFITRNGTDALQFSATNQVLPVVQTLPISISVTNRITLSTETATNSDQTVYISTNLTDWATGISAFFSEPESDWMLFPPENEIGYFHANRVIYFPDTNRTVDVTDHHLSLNVTLNVEGPVKIQLWPTEEYWNPEIEDWFMGTAKFADFPIDNIWSWELDLQFPYKSIVYVETDFGDAYRAQLHYLTPTNGNCFLEFFIYDDDDEQFILVDSGDGTFTDFSLE